MGPVREYTLADSRDFKCRTSLFVADNAVWKKKSAKSVRFHSIFLNIHPKIWPKSGRKPSFSSRLPNCSFLENNFNREILRSDTITNGKRHYAGNSGLIFIFHGFGVMICIFIERKLKTEYDSPIFSNSDSDYQYQNLNIHHFKYQN